MGDIKASYKIKVYSGKLKIKFIKEDKFFQKIYQTSMIEHKGSFNFQESNIMASILEEFIEVFLDIEIKIEFQALEDNTVYSITIS